MNKELQEVINSSDIIIHEGIFIYYKLKKEIPLEDHFMISKDQDEITLVTNKALDTSEYLEDYGRFKLLEIKVSIPFTTVGFLAKITETISSKGLNVLIISTFSKDYALVREETAEEAIKALKELGFPVK